MSLCKHHQSAWWVPCPREKKWTEIGKSTSLRDGADKGKAKAEQAQRTVQKLKGWEWTLGKVLVVPVLQAELGENFRKSTVLYMATTLPSALKEKKLNRFLVQIT